MGDNLSTILASPQTVGDITMTILSICDDERRSCSFFGDRSETTAQKLGQARTLSCLPDDADDYHVCPLPAPPDADQTNHQERWNNTLYTLLYS
jgi:hypothetical protein